MKKILITSLFFCFFSTKLPAITPPTFTPLPLLLVDLSVAEFLLLSPKELETRTGRKLSFSEKISLKMIKAQMKKAARKQPDLTVAEFLRSRKNKSAGSAILYILLGAVLVFFVLFLMLYTDSNR